VGRKLTSRVNDVAVSLITFKRRNVLLADLVQLKPNVSMAGTRKSELTFSGQKILNFLEQEKYKVILFYY
jgi:hypothetical protein